MQHAGWKTSEKAISEELLQDFTAKSLFNTLFMMFNSRYQGKNLPQGLAPTTRQRIGRMYYILNAGEPINDFAVRLHMHWPPNKDTSRDGKRILTKRKLVVGSPNCSRIVFNF
jgi:hypothetical protein